MSNDPPSLGPIVAAIHASGAIHHASYDRREDVTRVCWKADAAQLIADALEEAGYELVRKIKIDTP